MARHLQMLERACLDAIAGRTPRLIVTMPPRHGKSNYISQWLPTWYLGTYPHNRIILSSYGADYAATWGAKVRDSIASEGWRFGIKLKNTAPDEIKLVGAPDVSLTTAGVGGSLTGKGANLFIIDDPVKNAEEALSPRYREKAFDWWQSTAYTRLEPDAVVILLMTRWHLADLAGQLIDGSGVDGHDSWTVLNLPAIAEPNDPMGRAVGEALWPERWSLKALESKKASMKDFWWQSMYQQRPVAEGRNIYRKEWWKWYDFEEKDRILREAIYVLQGYDTAFKAGTSNDYTAAGTWCVMPNMDVYLVDAWQERLTFPELMNKSYRYMDAFEPHRIVVEDKASGQSMIQVLRDDGIPVTAMPAENDLVFRSHLVTGLIESGRVYLPKDAPFMDEYMATMEHFPYYTHDDYVSMTCVTLQHIQDVAKTDRRGEGGGSRDSVGRGTRKGRGSRQRDSITDLF